MSQLIETFTVMLFIATFFAFVGSITILPDWLKRKKRSRDLAKLAPILGLDFTERVSPEFKNLVRGFRILRFDGSSYRNICFAKRPTFNYHLFDYWKVGNGGNGGGRMVVQSAVLFQTEAALFPNMSIRPKDFIEAMMTPYGSHGIQTGVNHIDRYYVVEGNNERAIIEALSGPLLPILRSADSKIHLQIIDRRIVYYRQKQFYEADDLERHEAASLHFFERLTEQTATAPHNNELSSSRRRGSTY